MAIANRLIRNTTVLYKRESSQNTDSTPGGSDGVLVLTGVDFMPDFQAIDREVARPFLGASPKLVGPQLTKLSGLRYELAGSGTAGTAPKWADLLLSLGFAEAALTSPARVEYTPVSTNFKTGTAYVYADGVLYKSVGNLGTGTLDLTVGTTPKVMAEMTGLHESHATGTISPPGMGSWQIPVVVKPISTVDIKLGCTYSAGAISGGTQYASRGVVVNIGNDVQHILLCSDEFMTIPSREMSAQITMSLTAAEEVALLNLCQAATETSIGFEVGSVAGNILKLFAPRGILRNPRPVNQQGVRLMQFDVDLCPSNNGSDELRIVVM